jgi:AcrR family transcriptional regulator
MADQQRDGRRRRSDESRHRIVAAATERFVERGYVSTTIEDIAAAAGVAVQTVYYAFGTKPHVLAAVLDARIAGDLDPLPIAERPWVAAIGQTDDAAEELATLVAACVALLARVSPIFQVVLQAAADPEVGRLLVATRTARRADQRRMVGRLRDAGHLRSGLAVDDAADVFYALVNEEVFNLLVGDCAWELARFHRWLEGALAAQLLDPTGR